MNDRKEPYLGGPDESHPARSPSAVKDPPQDEPIQSPSGRHTDFHELVPGYDRQSSAGMIFCRGRGRQIHIRASVCPHCGAAQSQARRSNRPATGFIVSTYIVAGVIPIAGIGMNIYLLFRKEFLNGVVDIILTIFMIFFWASFWPAFRGEIHCTYYAR